MTTYLIQFHRYSTSDGSRLSAADFIQAEDFWDAAGRAQLMCRAMQSADPARNYIIAKIECQGLRGEECTSGWETSEEFSARIKEANNG